MTESITRFPNISGMGAVTAKLVELLRSPETPSPLTDEAIYQACGRRCHVGAEGYGNLLTAIRHVARNHAINWRREVGAAAIVRLDARQSIQAADADRRHVKKTTSRAMTTLGNAKIESLPEREQTEARAMMAQLGALSLFASGHTRKQLEARKATEAPNMRQLLEAWPRK
jgi:hypothetical protein